MEQGNTEQAGTDSITQENQPKPTTPSPLNSSSSKKFLTIVGVLVGFLLFGLGGYYLGTQSGNGVDYNQVNTDQPVSTVPPSMTPSSNIGDISLGGTKVSYAISNGKVLIKTEMNLVDKVFEYPNSELRSVVKIYSQDSPYHDPEELTDSNASDYSWIDLVSKKMENTTNAASILVFDHLFSLKQIPNSDSFLFVVTWSRSASDSEAGPWLSTLDERTLYLFDGNVVTEVITMTSDENSQQYAYPKIDTVSSDSKYVSLKLFGCWECGGHQPETLLIDLQSLKSNNIGKVLEFAWNQNGDYKYKDYIAIECEEPGPGECSQDPNTLPLMTGSI